MSRWKRNFLSFEEESKVEERITNFERKTGAELILCICRSSDPYPAANYRIAIAITAFLSFGAVSFLQFSDALYLLIMQLFLLFLGLVLSNVPFLKSFALLKNEINREVEEKALELFNTYNLKETKSRVGILLVVSILEKKIELLVDKKLKEKISQNDLDNIVKIIEENFKSRKFDRGLLSSIDALEEKVLHFFPESVQEKDLNELDNKIRWNDFSS